jgi:hypothetical protein
MCDYCGVMWRRSQLHRNQAGRLACPDDIKGEDEVALTEANAMSAGRERRPKTHNDGANYDSGVNTVEHLTTLEDIEL